LPPHQDHKQKAEEQEESSSNTVLETDYFMIGRENILSPKWHFMMASVAMFSLSHSLFS
jgi:hypothetical protein